jgi:hypothetical protein
MFSTYIGEGVHLDCPLGRYLNHSFTPNTRIHGDKVVALGEVPADTELTYNYNESESAGMAEPFFTGEDLTRRLVSGRVSALYGISGQYRLR